MVERTLGLTFRGSREKKSELRRMGKIRNRQSLKERGEIVISGAKAEV